MKQEMFIDISNASVSQEAFGLVIISLVFNLPVVVLSQTP